MKNIINAVVPVKKAVIAIIALLVLQAGIVAVGASAGHANEEHAGLGYSLSISRLCVTPTTADAQGERICAKVWKYRGHRLPAIEGNRILKYVESEWEPNCVRYLGWSRYDLSDGDTYRSVESGLKPKTGEYRYHIYKIIDTSRCQQVSVGPFI